MYEVPMEISKFKAFLHTLSEKDGDKIDELCGDITAMMHTKMPTGAPSNLSEMFWVYEVQPGLSKPCAQISRPDGLVRSHRPFKAKQSGIF